MGLPFHQLMKMQPGNCWSHMILFAFGVKERVFVYSFIRANQSITHTHTHFLYHPLVFLFWRERGGGGQGREVSLSFLENYLPWFKFPCNHCFYFRHNCWVICNKRRQIYSWLLKCIPLLMQGALNSFKILFFNLKLLFFKFEFFLFFFWWVNLGF